MFGSMRFYCGEEVYALKDDIGKGKIFLLMQIKDEDVS